MNFEDTAFYKINQYISQRMKERNDDLLREYSEDGFRIINSDAVDYVSENKDLDFLSLVNLIDTEK